MSANDEIARIMNSKVIRTKTERKFLPQRLLLNAARHQFAEATRSEAGSTYNLLATVLLSALCIEAIGNTYGELLIHDWERDFDNSSPRAKLRLVANQCRLTPDFGTQPWQTACLLIKFRNKIAHARPEELKFQNEQPTGDHRKDFSMRLESDVEKLITPEFAKKSLNAVNEILNLLNKPLTDAQLNAVTHDGHRHSAEMEGTRS